MPFICCQAGREGGREEGRDENKIDRADGRDGVGVFVGTGSRPWEGGKEKKEGGWDLPSRGKEAG